MLLNLHNRPSGACVGGGGFKAIPETLSIPTTTFQSATTLVAQRNWPRKRFVFYLQSLSAEESISMPYCLFFQLGHGPNGGLRDSPQVWHAIPGPVGFSMGGGSQVGEGEESNLTGIQYTQLMPQTGKLITSSALVDRSIFIIQCVRREEGGNFTTLQRSCQEFTNRYSQETLAHTNWEMRKMPQHYHNCSCLWLTDDRSPRIGAAVSLKSVSIWSLRCFIKFDGYIQTGAEKKSNKMQPEAGLKLMPSI